MVLTAPSSNAFLDWLAAHTQDVVTCIVLLLSDTMEEDVLPGIVYETLMLSLTSWHRKSPSGLHRFPGHLHLTLGISGGILCESMSRMRMKVQVDLLPILYESICGLHFSGELLRDKPLAPSVDSPLAKLVRHTRVARRRLSILPGSTRIDLYLFRGAAIVEFRAQNSSNDTRPRNRHTPTRNVRGKLVCRPGICT